MGELKLKRCPFCKRDAEYLQTACNKTDRNSVVMYFRIQCHKCRSSPDEAGGRVDVRLSLDGELVMIRDDRQKAAKAWNRRGFDDAETAGEPGD